MPTPNLADLLAKRPPIPPSPPITAPPPAAPLPPAHPGLAAHPAETGTPVIDDPGPARSATDATGTPREYLRSITLYLPRTVHHQLGAAATERGTTRTALILTAVNNTHHRLAAAMTSPPPASPTGNRDLFAVPQNKPNPEPSVQTTIRITDAQHAAITALVAEHGTNRSRLVNTALQLHLGLSR